jgi:hypothetical protein
MLERARAISMLESSALFELVLGGPHGAEFSHCDHAHQARTSDERLPWVCQPIWQTPCTFALAKRELVR